MKEFEHASNEIEKGRSYELEVENCIEFLKGSDTATVTFTQGRYISKVEKLAEKFPDEVKICHRNYHPSGNISSIVAHIPVRAIKINLTAMTEEQKEEARERLAKAREDRNNLDA